MVQQQASLNGGGEGQFILPGHQIPQWFSYECDQDSIDFILDSIKSKEMAGIVICAAFELDCKSVSFSLELVVDDVAYLSHSYSSAWGKNNFNVVKSIMSAKAGNLCFHYFPGCLSCGNYKVSFSAKEKPSEKFLSKCGVHILDGRSDTRRQRKIGSTGYMICT